MKLTINRTSLLKPLQQIIGVVERRQTLPVLSNVLIRLKNQDLFLTTSDLEVELVAKQVCINAGNDTEITLPARKLLDICKTLPEEADLILETKENRLQIKSGKSKFLLATLPAQDFPVVEDINSQLEFSITQKQLKTLLEQTQFSMAQQDVRYYLNGLLLEIEENKISAVATDGHRLAKCTQSIEASVDQVVDVIVPRKAIQELSRISEDSDEAVIIKIGSNHIRLQLGDLQFTSKLIDGKFPDYKRVIPKLSEHVITADREELRQSLTRTAILSNEKYRGIRVEIKKEMMRLQAHNPEQEQAEEEIAVQYAGNDLDIGFNVTYLMDALNATHSIEVILSMTDSNSSCLICMPEDTSCQYVVMPMRL